jgi:hypothetical protein
VSEIKVGLRHNPPRFVVGTFYDHPICFCRSYARQTQQLVFCSSVQIELLVAAPTFADPCRHSLGIALHIRCCLRGLLLWILQALLLSTTEHSKQQTNQNVAISGDSILISSFPLYSLISQPCIETWTIANPRRMSRV